MKRRGKCLAMVLTLCLIFTSVFGNTFVTPTKAAESKRVLKLLSIGNSFSQDAQRWIYQVAADAGFDEIIVANLYWGGCSLWQHWSNAQSDYAGYEYQKNTTGEIEYTNLVSIKTAVLDEDWDFITIQQVSGYSGLADTYNSDLTNLVSYIKQYATNPNMKLGWHMTWAYQSDSNHGDFSRYNNNQMTMYNAIVNATREKILTNKDISFVIPAGTAIQNLRTSFLGDTLTRDGYHMSYELGRYVVALTWIYKICDLLGYERPTGVTYTPDKTKVPPTYLPAIHESVQNAINTPLAVTNSSYTTAASMLNHYSYKQLDWQPYCYGYWNSTDTTTYDYIATDAFNSSYFIASGTRFTKEQIPYGSVIVLQNGYQYRPEGWNQLGQLNQSNRPDTVNTPEMIVDEEWWGNFNYRGFNLSAISGSINGTTADQARNILKIYVPTNNVTAANNIESFKLMGKDCVVGECTISTTVAEGTDVSNLVPDIRISGGCTISPSASQPQDFSKPVHYKVTNAAGHTKIYTVTLSYKKAIDLTMYDQIDWSPILNAYWHSAGPATQTLGSDNKYIASRLFSKSEIPVGSIIEVDAGYQYRPEAWTDMTSSTPNRPGVVTKAQVVVDDAWWGNYNYRAFNVSTISQVSLTGQTDAAIAAFRIYVPKKIVEVFGAVISNPENGMINVVWGNPGNNQMFNVYVDGTLAVSSSGQTLSNVPCASYMIPTTEGTHTVKITTTYGGMTETAGVTQSITVVGNATVEPETRTFDAYSVIEAELYAYNQGGVIDTNSGVSNGHNIGGVNNGVYMRYDNVNFGEKAKGITLCYSSPAGVASGNAEIYLESLDNKIGTVELINNGSDWSAYSVVTGELDQEIGVGSHTIYIKYVATNGAYYVANVDYFSFVKTADIEKNKLTIVNDELKINGYQVSATAQGMRTIYSVEDKINGKNVVESGLVYSLADYAPESDVHIASENAYVKSYQSTEKGVCSINQSGSATATTYAMTMLFASKTAAEFNSSWRIRAYAKLSDGSYVYTECVEYKIFEIANKLYQGQMMNNYYGHNYLYTDILTVVNPGYVKVDYDLNNTLAKL